MTPRRGHRGALGPNVTVSMARTVRGAIGLRRPDGDDQIALLAGQVRTQDAERAAGRPASLNLRRAPRLTVVTAGRLEAVGRVGPALAQVAELGVHRPAVPELALDVGVDDKLRDAGGARADDARIHQRPGDLGLEGDGAQRRCWSSGRAGRRSSPRPRGGAPRRPAPNEPSARKPVVGLETSNSAPMKVSRGVRAWRTPSSNCSASTGGSTSSRLVADAGADAASSSPVTQLPNNACGRSG